MQMFGALQSATVVTLLLQDLMTGPFAVGIVLRSLFLLRKKKRRLEEIFEADIDNTFEDKHIPKEELPEEGAVALAGKRNWKP